MQIYCDMDGVAADFDTHYEACFGIRPSKADDNVDWQAVRDRRGFYQDMPPMADWPVLWDFLRHYKPIMLTGIPWSVEEAPQNKRDWCAIHAPGAQVITCKSRDKALHCRPGDVLIDDWEKYRHVWIAAGGRWITHRNAQSTILDLFSIMSPAGLTPRT